ncbi:TIGR03862 family flavoprotein [Pseudooceanicola sediminis]|uniref:TIGR03862 family flavoprotein n=1 Tax=Pseudooceanicola sediminis TaxID=2211117 RepID=A0A399IZ98_9RHOB|nr:TIGR03862 family flavoprotein [Pseudooceanicola sediminis]KAA2313367.1 TIGR03862 family flavoprotein [Puniceibacterium sp. HSS470]RII38351.1 TIGR03862 family flavoprotein [Pseudooceanicola sediminis]|tara:strand:+ start:17302 stop:18471 length:1170 start_codon:yes stop_codon:yes gene_type:complete
MRQALVIGGGPAGLMSAEALSAAGLAVTVAEKMPTMGRKVLMAGKSGLNLTKEEARDAFVAAFRADWLRAPLQAFGPSEVRAWTEALGISTFAGSTGRVFPVGMKASPLLRAWLARLDAAGVALRTRWDWQGWADGGDALFATPGGLQRVAADVTVLALGGASWPRLGSDGGWVRHVGPVAPFRPANCGFHVAWSHHMATHFGAPVKAVVLRAGAEESRGEIVLSRDGIEGGGIYALAHLLRDGVALRLDLLPNHTQADVAARLAGGKAGESLSNRLRKALRLDAAKRALVQECARPLPDDPQALAALLKDLPVPLGGPMDMARAISCAGGLRADALDAGLMLTARPGVFAAGEMLDWEAPTGGYLLTGCMATGLWAGRHAAAYGQSAG